MSNSDVLSKLARVHFEIIQSLYKDYNRSWGVNGETINSNEKSRRSCNGCIIGKIDLAPIPKKINSQASAILDLGTIEVQSIKISQYCILFKTFQSIRTVKYTMRNDLENFKYFKMFHKYAQAHTGCKHK